MSSLRTLTLVLLLALLPSLAAAQFDTSHPGYFPIEDLGILPEETLNLEINLPGSMLKFVAAAMDEEDPGFARIADNLESIRVRGADLEGTGLESVRSGFRNASERLKAAGWLSMVRIREDDEEVYVYFKEEAGKMMGMTVFTLEDGEAMMINLVGEIDPEDLGDLARGLDLDIPDINPSGGDENQN